MPSILPGYEYDIFISYRHNDNQDGWVTRFVEALQKELRATLKNEVNIYFDENPHDGLLDTHLVDASLAKKLKCLVFIPIVSQTYCDKNSFAWQHEFMPFLEMAKHDELGMNVTLSNGNVVSRVLPVRIHDLDNEDQHILEAVLNGPLRSIDFIYQESGVNRSLRISEVKPTSNLNNTTYRDQINKVANALKDIGTSILKTENIDAYDLPQHSSVNAEPGSVQSKIGRSKKKLLVPISIVAILAVTFFLFKQFVFQERVDKKISEVGLAIMPFKNISSEHKIDFLSYALKDEIHDELALSKKFAFLSSSQATATYKDKDILPKMIGEELGVDFVLSGSYQISGDQLNVRVEFTDAGTSNSVWSHKFIVDYEEANIFPIQREIAQKVLSIFNEADEKISDDDQIVSFESYDHYVKGLEWVQKGANLDNRLKAINEFGKAISLDSTHTRSWIQLVKAKSHVIFNKLVTQDKYLNEIENHLGYLSENHPEWASELAQGIYQYHALQNYDEGLKHLKKVVAQYPDNETANNLISAIYKRKLRVVDSYKIRLKLISMAPQYTGHWMELATLFQINGDYKHGLQAYNRALELGIDSIYYSNLPFLYRRAAMSMDSIPARYSANMKNKVLRYKIYATNNPRTIIEQLKDIPLDSISSRYNYTELQYYVDLAELYFALSLDDSASYYAKLVIIGNEQKDEKDWRGLRSAYNILGDHLKSQDIRSQEINPDTEDLFNQANQSEEDIYNLVLSQKYAEATRMLIDLNRKYPEYGDFFWLRHSFYYDRAKEEYPPFAAAVDNLKLPPSLVEDKQLARLNY